MENDVLESLSDLGYTGPLLDETKLLNALEQGPKSLDFNKLVCILTDELKQLCNLEEVVNVMNDASEANIFLFELSSFLKELGCPYSSLVTGHLSSRLQSKEEAGLLLDYLISELMAARMVNVDKPKSNDNMDIVMQETPTAKDLKDVLIALKFNKPPPSITPEVLFSKLEAKVRDVISKEGEQFFGKPLYNKSLSEKQWQELEKSYAELLEEYRLRRETLITRLDCTVQSFEWSDRLKTRKDSIQAQYRPKRSNLKVKPDIKLSDFLAARTDLLQVEKTSSATVRKNTQSDVNKVIIGSVPDRGGRPNEQQPPPPEMPSWQQRTQPSARGGRGGGPPRGGRVQGGYNQTNHDNRPQSSQSNMNSSRGYQTYEVPAGGYQNNQGYQGGYQQQGYQKNDGYNSGSGYRQQSNRGGYNNSGQYNNNPGGYNNSQTGYNNSQPGYNNSQPGYNNSQGGYNNRYRNEHDDRTQNNYRGHSNYNRGGRR